LHSFSSGNAKADATQQGKLSGKANKAIKVKVATAQSGPPGAARNWRKTFEDNFSSSTLDVAKWNSVWPWGNGENRTYPDSYFTSNNVLLSGGGTLRLKGNNDGANGKKFTAAVITTKDKFSQQYGYFEIRCRFPKGKGLWPAFWLLAQEDKKPQGLTGWYEIDVFEVLGHDTTTVHMNNIFPGKDKNGSKMASFKGEDVSNGFHTFGLLWEAGRTRIYIDGVQRYENTEGVPDQPMYLLVNTAVGGAWPSSWKQEPDATTPYPNYLDVDYVRAWKRVAQR
jgi:beta-glucanase (GH16 family)